MRVTCFLLPLALALAMGCESDPSAKEAEVSPEVAPPDTSQSTLDAPESTDGTDSADSAEGTGDSDPCEGTGVPMYEGLSEPTPMPELPGECVALSPEEYPEPYYPPSPTCCYTVHCTAPPWCAEPGTCLPYDNGLDLEPPVSDFCDCDPLELGPAPREGPDGTCCYLVGKVQCL